MTMNVDEQKLIAIFQECLQAPEPYEDELEKETCEKLIAALPEELLQQCATSSYAYWYLCKYNKNDPPTEEDTKKMAMREARRHWKFVGGKDFDKALKNLTECCQRRKDDNANALRTCFQAKEEAKEDETEEEKKHRELQLSMKEKILADAKRQPLVVRGHDSNTMMALLVKTARTEPGTTEEEYIMAQCYAAERCIACSEFLSRGKQEQVVTVFDYNNFNSSNAPATSIQRAAITSQQGLFPDRLSKTTLLSPPFWLRTLYAPLKVLLPSSITSKIGMSSDREALFSSLGDGSKGLGDFLADPSSINMERYFNEIPFYCPYNSEDYLSNLTSD